MPNAVLFVREVEAALKKEQAKRTHFYEAIDENKKMEFINGEIFFQSPVKLRHNVATLNVAKLLGTYTERHQLGFVGVEKILVSLSRNDYEPDVCFFARERSIQFLPDQMQFPAPDLVVEVISNSTEHHDRVVKYQDYAAHGVREYWIVDPENETIEQYSLNDDLEYELVLKSKDGTISSVAVLGFSVPVRAVFDNAVNLLALKEMVI